MHSGLSGRILTACEPRVRGSAVAFMRFVKLLVLVSVCAALTPHVVSAQSACTSPSPDCVVVGEWDLSVSVGIGERSNPIARGKDIPLVLLPQLSYYGKRFFLDNLELGFTLHESAAHTLNLVATPGYDRVFFIRDDPQNYFVVGAGSSLGTPSPEVQEAFVRSRSTTYFVGPEWLFNVGNVTGQLSALYEATGRHKGQEMRGAIAIPVLQATSSLVASVGFTWKSAETVDYYYGVDQFYRGQSAFSPFVKLGFTRTLNERWSINAFIHHERLDDAISDSPIVVRDSVTTAFAGVVFKVF